MQIDLLRKICDDSYIKICRICGDTNIVGEEMESNFCMYHFTHHVVDGNKDKLPSNIKPSSSKYYTFCQENDWVDSLMYTSKDGVIHIDKSITQKSYETGIPIWPQLLMSYVDCICGLCD